MKRCSIIVIGLIVLMGLASASYAIYPKPDSQAPFQMQQGWFNGQLVWFIATDTNNAGFARSMHLTLAPKLSSAIGSGAAAMYIVRNPATSQGPIFEVVPGGMPYSGVWQVIYVDWQLGFPKVPIVSQTQIVTLTGLGAITQTIVPIVIDAPIMAVGPLGGPWFPGPVGSYRIPQGRVLGNYMYTKQIWLPTYRVFSENEITEHVTTVQVIITDAETLALAALLKANYAPGLASIPFSDTMRFWEILDSPLLCQLPVIQAGPLINGAGSYSPIVRLSLLNRGTADPSAVITNDEYIRELLYDEGVLSINDESSRLNAPVVMFF